MLDIELAKLPPPKPASAATNSITPNGVSGFPTLNPRAIDGMSRRPAEMIVQLRPPNLGTRKVYGNRRVAPTRLGIEMSCLLYTSDAADDLLCVDLGGRRIIKK